MSITSDETLTGIENAENGNKGEDEIPEDSSEDGARPYGHDKILYRRVEEDESIRITRYCATPEVRYSAYANPFVFSQLSGIGVFAFLDQLLRLWPSARMDALPYLSIPSVITGTVGFGIGIHSLYHPKDEHTNPFKRVWFATLEGFGIIFPFVMGEQILVYCADPSHLDVNNECEVSDATFWGHFFPAPTVLALAYSVWKAIPLFQKTAWMAHGKVKKAAVVLLDSLADTLFYSRIFQTFATNIYRIQQPLWYELAIPLSMVILLLQTRKPKHSEKVKMLINMGMTGNLMAYLIKFSLAELTSTPKQSSDWWAAISQLVSFGSFMITGLGFTLWRSKRSVIEWRKVPRWIPAGYPKLLLAQQLNEALERPEVRQQLIARLLQDQQMKEQLLRDETIKNLLWQDPTIRDSLAELIAEKWNLQTVDLGPPSDLTEPLSPPVISNGGEEQISLQSQPPIVPAFNASRARRRSSNPHSVVEPGQTPSQEAAVTSAPRRKTSCCSCTVF